MSTETTARPTTFGHVNLNTVDPGRAPVPDGTYNFRLAKVEQRTYNPKGQPEGSGEYLNLSLLITESPEYSGRRVFASFFPGETTNKQLRLLMDATGVPVDGEWQGQEDAVAWLDQIRTSGATFSAALATKPRFDKRSGTTEPRQDFQGFTIAPAQ
jgi:hypothetical protein